MTNPTLNRRRFLKAGVAISALPFLSPAAFALSPNPSAPSADIAAYINSQIAKHKLPGAGLAFVEDAKVKWEAGFGVTNIETGQPVTTKTLFQAASLSKPIFAYVIFQLIDQGKLSLDDRLSDYVKPSDMADHPWARQITVRDALQHTSGLPNWRDNDKWIEPLMPAYEPGTDSNYSGEAYHWLQRVAERITGKGLDAFMRKQLFKPANLSDMSMLWQPSRDDREVYSHELDDNGNIVLTEVQWHRERGTRYNEVATRWQYPMENWTTWDQRKAASEMRSFEPTRMATIPFWEWATAGRFGIDSASSLRCTPGDYARFMCLMMTGTPRGEWQIKEETRQLMLTPQYYRPDVQNGVLPRGLGFGLETRPNGVAYYHWGKNGDSMHAVAIGDPQSRKAMVVMTHGVNGKAFIRETVTDLIGENYIGITT